ncbi:MAG: S1/P1 nuclease [Saprospiraceae bacterium]
MPKLPSRIYSARIANEDCYLLFIRSEKSWDFTKNWHFATINPDETVEEYIEKNKKDPKINDVIEAIELMKAILAGDQEKTKMFDEMIDDNKAARLKGSTKATALAFLVHFIGDVHQPMHVGKNNDYGGNKIIVQFFDKRSNLHSVWDEGIIEKEQLSFTEFSNFINKLSKKDMKVLQQNPIEKWVSESVEAGKIFTTPFTTIPIKKLVCPIFLTNTNTIIFQLSERLTNAGACGLRAYYVAFFE